MGTELKMGLGKGITDATIVKVQVKLQGWKLFFQRAVIISTVSRSLKFTTALKHLANNFAQLTLYGKVDFSKKHNNSVFGVSVNFGFG